MGMVLALMLFCSAAGVYVLVATGAGAALGMYPYTPIAQEPTFVLPILAVALVFLTVVMRRWLRLRRGERTSSGFDRAVALTPWLVGAGVVIGLVFGVGATVSSRQARAKRGRELCEAVYHRRPDKAAVEACLPAGRACAHLSYFRSTPVIPGVSMDAPNIECVRRRLGLPLVEAPR